MLPHKKMASAFTETISNKIFFCFFHCLLDRGHFTCRLTPIFLEPISAKSVQIVLIQLRDVSPFQLTLIQSVHHKAYRSNANHQRCDHY